MTDISNKTSQNDFKSFLLQGKKYLSDYAENCAHHLENYRFTKTDAAIMGITATAVALDLILTSDLSTNLIANFKKLEAEHHNTNSLYLTPGSCYVGLTTTLTLTAGAFAVAAKEAFKHALSYRPK